MFRSVAAIFGMPRSGTSWIGQIFDSSPEVAYRLEPIFSYAFKDAVGAASTPAQFQAFYESIYRSRDAFMLQAEKREQKTYPTFEKDETPRLLSFKTTRYHNLIEPMLERSPTLQIVCVVRHPCGAIHSWLTTPKEFPSDADPSTEWRTGLCRNAAPEEFWGFEDWKTVTSKHLELEALHPDRVRVVRYEELVAQPFEETKAMFDFIRLTVDDQTVRFLEDCHQRHSDDQHAVFKNPSVAWRWRDELDPGIQSQISAELRGTQLARFLPG